MLSLTFISSDILIILDLRQQWPQSTDTIPWKSCTKEHRRNSPYLRMASSRSLLVACSSSMYATPYPIPLKSLTRFRVLMMASCQSKTQCSQWNMAHQKKQDSSKRPSIWVTPPQTHQYIRGWKASWANRTSLNPKI